MARHKLNPRKLLIASTGVATMSYLALTPGCGAKSKHSTVANLMAIQYEAGATQQGTGPEDTTPAPGQTFTDSVANLMAPPTYEPSSVVANLPAPPTNNPPPTVANLVAPPFDSTSVVANLPAPPTYDPTSVVANLPAPPTGDPPAAGGAAGVGGAAAGGQGNTGGGTAGVGGTTGVLDAGVELDAQAPLLDAAVDSGAGGR